MWGRGRGLRCSSLNEVRPRRPEQWVPGAPLGEPVDDRLNEVRPRRPEQFGKDYQGNSAYMVSMKSGLEGRNNRACSPDVRWGLQGVSMKSGLEGRNNSTPASPLAALRCCLNEVRPRRPEQSTLFSRPSHSSSCLNEVRPRRPEQSRPRFRQGGHGPCLNEVRPRRPEQFASAARLSSNLIVSMKSGLEGRNNPRIKGIPSSE